MKNKLVKQMNKFLADSIMLYVKIHNLHWNVVGMQFKPVHEFLEVVYDGIAEELDVVAELLKMNGVYPAASVSEYTSLSDVKELESKDYTCDDAIKQALEILEKRAEQIKEIRETADEEGEFSIVGAMEDMYGNYEKNIWFLKSMLA